MDEVHRFNKAQQDALLPWVENGTVILIGATTENPYFEVNKALVSRSRIFQLKPLTEATCSRSPARRWPTPSAATASSTCSSTTTRWLTWSTWPTATPAGCSTRWSWPWRPRRPDDEGVVLIDLAVAEESIQRRAVLYDKEGDVHYDTISAFIKSLRGSDPDAALYWLARMVYAGEDPRFIFRRMIIFAGEDVGLADPNALRVVMACAQAFDYVGLPEGRFHLAEAALYLATAPKSNSALAFFDALGVVEKEREAEVPSHLRDANRDTEGFGHGEGYLYPHAYRDHWVAQQYLPEALQGRVFYQPGEVGYEQAIKAEVERRREAQLAAMLEGAEGFGATEALTYTGDKAGGERDRWLARAVSGAGERLERAARPAGGRGPAAAAQPRARPERGHRAADLGGGAPRAGGRRVGAGRDRCGRRTRCASPRTGWARSSARSMLQGTLRDVPRAAGPARGGRPALRRDPRAERAGAGRRE